MVNFHSQCVSSRETFVNTRTHLARTSIRHDTNTLGKNKHTSRANNTKHFRKPLKCLKCAGPHRLIDCKMATPEEKEELWKKFSATFKKKPMYHTQANKATTTSDEKTTTTTKSDTKHPHQAHVTIKSSNNERRLHWANQVSHNSQPFSHMSEWLIDSGCSNHMTPHEKI